jgi:hypothetical protein
MWMYYGQLLEITPPDSGDRHGVLGHFLAADVGEILFVMREFLEEFDESRGSGLDIERSRRQTNCSRKVGDGDHVESFNDCRFGRVGSRYDDAA